MKTKLHFFFSLTILYFSNTLAQTQEAKYSITFNSVWNSTDHGTLPGNAHWSKLVGVTHKTSGAFLEMGKKATTGIKDVAERGNNDNFNNEVTSAINNNEANQYINGSNLSTATGDININNLIVNKNFPLLTLISMIAPSPDWMIAVNGVDLLDSNSNWKSSITIDLFPYDAGTDSGTSYTSGNSVTNPTENITSLKSVSPFNDQKIGTLTITLVETLSINSFKLKDNITIFYNSNNKNINVKANDKIEVLYVEVFNIIGKLVKKESIKNKLISLQNSPNGVYLLKITTNKGIISKKIIKS